MKTVFAASLHGWWKSHVRRVSHEEQLGKPEELTTQAMARGWQPQGTPSCPTWEGENKEKGISGKAKVNSSDGLIVTTVVGLFVTLWAFFIVKHLQKPHQVTALPLDSTCVFISAVFTVCVCMRMCLWKRMPRKGLCLFQIRKAREVTIWNKPEAIKSVLCLALSDSSSKEKGIKRNELV